VKRPKRYGTLEAAKILGVSKPTLLRWFAENRIREVRRDHRAWRVFTVADIRRIEREVFRNAQKSRSGT
jgi:excisionase family DNA binding protein